MNLTISWQPRTEGRDRGTRSNSPHHKHIFIYTHHLVKNSGDILLDGDRFDWKTKLDSRPVFQRQGQAVTRRKQEIICLKN